MARFYHSLHRLAGPARLALAGALLAPLLALYDMPLAVVRGSLFHGWAGPGASELYYAGTPWTPGPLAAVNIVYRLGLAWGLLGLAALIYGLAQRNPWLVEASAYIIVFSTAIASAAAQAPPLILKPLEGNYIYRTSLGILDLGRVTVGVGEAYGLLQAYTRTWLPLALGLALLSVAPEGENGGEPRGS